MGEAEKIKTKNSKADHVETEPVRHDDMKSRCNISSPCCISVQRHNIQKTACCTEPNASTRLQKIPYRLRPSMRQTGPNPQSPIPIQPPPKSARRSISFPFLLPPSSLPPYYSLLNSSLPNVTSCQMSQMSQMSKFSTNMVVLPFFSCRHVGLTLSVSYLVPSRL